jgi:hypothetical protein
LFANDVAATSLDMNSQSGALGSVRNSCGLATGTGGKPLSALDNVAQHRLLVDKCSLEIGLRRSMSGDLPSPTIRDMPVADQEAEVGECRFG